MNFKFEIHFPEIKFQNVIPKSFDGTHSKISKIPGNFQKMMIGIGLIFS